MLKKLYQQVKDNSTLTFNPIKDHPYNAKDRETYSHQPNSSTGCKNSTGGNIVRNINTAFTMTHSILMLSLYGENIQEDTYLCL